MLKQSIFVRQSLELVDLLVRSCQLSKPGFVADKLLEVTAVKTVNPLLAKRVKAIVEFVKLNKMG